MFFGATLAAALAVFGWSQESGTTIFRGENRKSFTILDQVSDPREKKAFRALYQEQEPSKKHRLAEKFLGAYPSSWLLAYVYEIACKTAIDLDDLDAALDYGRKSLRLLPENPFLLVSLANVQIHQQLTGQAVSSAKLALEYLDRFARPMRFSEKEWRELEPKLRSSCYYVLGRAAITKALGGSESDREEHHRKARQWLEASRKLDASDASAAYLLAITYLPLRKSHEAAIHFADVYRLGGPLKEKARAQLERLRQESKAAADSEFDDYVASLESPKWRTADQEAEVTQPSSPAPEYAGSESCKDCHREIFESWKQTGMARMFRAYQPENVFGDFTDQNEFPASGGVVQARMGVEPRRHYFEFRDDDGGWRRYDVHYTIGSKWQQAYATRLRDGRIHVFPIQYSKIHGKWINFWKVIDPPGSERADLEAFHRLSSLTSYQLNCAMCHTSQLSARKGGMHPSDFVYRETGINCEMCHGPSGAHVTATEAGRAELRAAAEPPIRFGKISHLDYVTICAQCHMQSNKVDFGARGEVNFTGDSLSFFRSYKSRPYPEFSRKAFYGDGRFRETTFIVESFLRSACFRKGEAHCGHCHDPHPADAASNPKSLRFQSQPNRMCLQCHGSYADDLEAHTRHTASSEGSRCASCHMPKIMHGLLFQAGTHRVDDIPDAEMTLRFGREESPNACLLCHDEEDANWVREQLARW